MLLNAPIIAATSVFCGALLIIFGIFVYNADKGGASLIVFALISIAVMVIAGMLLICSRAEDN